MQPVLQEKAGALSPHRPSQVCKRQVHLFAGTWMPPFLFHTLACPPFPNPWSLGLGLCPRAPATPLLGRPQFSSSLSPFALLLSPLLPSPTAPALCCHPTLPDAGAPKPPPLMPPSGLLPLVIQQPSQVEFLSQTPLSPLEEDCRVSQSWRTPSSSLCLCPHLPFPPHSIRAHCWAILPSAETPFAQVSGADRVDP